MMFVPLVRYVRPTSTNVYIVKSALMVIRSCRKRSIVPLSRFFIALSFCSG